jgi:hypothetical protein
VLLFLWLFPIRNGKDLTITEPKTRNSQLSVKLPGFVFDGLAQNWDSYKGNQGFIFTTETARPFLL